MKMKNGNKVILKVKILRKIKQLQKKQTKESEKKTKEREQTRVWVLGAWVEGYFEWCGRVCALRPRLMSLTASASTSASASQGVSRAQCTVAIARGRCLGPDADRCSKSSAAAAAAAAAPQQQPKWRPANCRGRNRWLCWPWSSDVSPFCGRKSSIRCSRRR